MTRRRFAFWVSFGLFSVAEKLRANGLDELAAEILRETKATQDSTPRSQPEHWIVANNEAWWWYERQTWSDDQWTTTGLTTPINRKTGERFTLKTGYLSDSLVPAAMRVVGQREPTDMVGEPRQEEEHGHPDPERRERHGRPPSKWLRSLHADEIRIWLKTISVPATGVSGMTFWTHLTRDHSFDAEKIEGLDEAEQAQLHAAAHYGY